MYALLRSRQRRHCGDGARSLRFCLTSSAWRGVPASQRRGHAARRTPSGGERASWATARLSEHPWPCQSNLASPLEWSPILVRARASPRCSRGDGALGQEGARPGVGHVSGAVTSAKSVPVVHASPARTSQRPGLVVCMPCTGVSSGVVRLGLFPAGQSVTAV